MCTKVPRLHMHRRHASRPWQDCIDTSIFVHNRVLIYSVKFIRLIPYLKVLQPSDLIKSRDVLLKSLDKIFYIGWWSRELLSFRGGSCTVAYQTQQLSLYIILSLGSVYDWLLLHGIYSFLCMRLIPYLYPLKALQPSSLNSPIESPPEDNYIFTEGTD